MIVFNMPHYYIKTKLHIPIWRTELIPRPRLHQKLSDGLARQNRMIVVSAPAGYGKTTLIRSWIETLDAAVAWYTLEEGDHDPHQFIIYLANAIQSALPECSEAALNLLDTHPAQSDELILTLLVNEITENKQPLVLVLDDFHLSETPEIIQIMTFLADHLPNHACLVLTTRTEPKIALSKYRARNAITEIGLHDLRFTKEETAQFFINNYGVSLSERSLQDLDQKAEGWIAGLQLIAMWLKDNADFNGNLRQLSGNAHYITAYLMDEVLNKQSAQIKNFLLRTSILEKLNPSLCSAVMEIPLQETQDLLSETARKNLFLISLDENQKWYRFHRLFSRLLQSKLFETHPDIIPTLHFRASRWFDEKGITEHALQHGLASEDEKMLSDVLEKNAESLLRKGQYDLFLKYSRHLEEETLNQRPLLQLYRATAMLVTEYPREKILAILDQIESCTEDFAGEILAIRAILQSYDGKPEKGIALSRKALNKINSERILFRNMVERNLGVAFTLQNDLKNANIWFENLLLSSYQLKDWGGVLAAYNYLTYIRKVQGRLNEAGVIYAKALKFIQEKGLKYMPHSIKIISGYGHLLLTWHRIKEAKAYFKRAIALAKKSDVIYAFTAYLNLSQALAMENDHRSALAVIQELRHLSRGKDDLYEQIHQEHTDAVEAKIFLESGKVKRAYDWMLSRGILQQKSLESALRFESGFFMPITAQILLKKGEYDQVIDLIQPLIPKFIQQGANAFLIRSLVALAIAYHRKGDSEKALYKLQKAIRLAKSENNLGDFLFFGCEIRTLLYQAMSSGLEESFSGKLLSYCVDQQNSREKQRQQAQRIDPLSQREMDVLALIAEGMTNQEIATELFLSKNTIKSHSIKIYRKLNVNNRNQAVSKARLLGILPGKYTPQLQHFSMSD